MAAQGRNKIEAVCDLAAGIVLRRAYELDTHPDLLNTPGGVVDLRTGEVQAHDPALMMTQITSGSYRPGLQHPDWVQALEALPPEERTWFQRRIGQAITARQPHDDRVLFLQGSGDNGKSAVTSHGLVPALGGYGRMVSVKLLQSSRGNDHPTEIADLRGRRLVLGEELTEHRAIDVGLLKRLQGTGRVTARSLYKDPIEFDLTHTLVCTTNYTPRVDETDHGTWRRLAMVRFPFTFRRKDEELLTPNDRHGDSGLRDRLKADRDGQHDAIVTWAVEGALAYFADPDQALALTDRVKADTREWQMDADRILGFWAECLVPDPKAFILTAELLNAFNRWLEENGHQKWAKETFHPRFLQHAETAQHRVDKARVREPRTGLSRPDMDDWVKIPTQPEVYRGVRFRSS